MNASECCHTELVGVQNYYIALSESPQAYSSFNHLTLSSRNKSAAGRHDMAPLEESGSR